MLSQTFYRSDYDPSLFLGMFCSMAAAQNGDLLITCPPPPPPLFFFFCQTFVNGQLRLEGKQEKGQGKCPFDPFQRYSSLMVGECQVLHQRQNQRKEVPEALVSKLSANFYLRQIRILKVPASTCIRCPSKAFKKAPVAFVVGTPMRGCLNSL